LRSIVDVNPAEVEELRKKGRRAPPSMCVAPGQDMVTGPGIDVAAFYRPGRCSNASWPGGIPELAANGAGNRFSIDFPIDHAEDRMLYKITLEAKDAKAQAQRSCRRLTG
jgi:hypothetical protein